METEYIQMSNSPYECLDKELYTVVERTFGDYYLKSKAEENIDETMSGGANPPSRAKKVEKVDAVQNIVNLIVKLQYCHTDENVKKIVENLYEAWRRKANEVFLKEASYGVSKTRELPKSIFVMKKKGKGAFSSIKLVQYRLGKRILRESLSDDETFTVYMFIEILMQNLLYEKTGGIGVLSGGSVMRNENKLVQVTYPLDFDASDYIAEKLEENSAIEVNKTVQDIVDVLGKINEKINFTHRDLHLKNVMAKMENGSINWYLIDFGEMCFTESCQDNEKVFSPGGCNRSEIYDSCRTMCGHQEYDLLMVLSSFVDLLADAKAAKTIHYLLTSFPFLKKMAIVFDNKANSSIIDLYYNWERRNNPDVQPENAILSIESDIKKNNLFYHLVYNYEQLCDSELKDNRKNDTEFKKKFNKELNEIKVQFSPENVKNILSKLPNELGILIS